MHTIPNNLKYYRKQANLTQEQVTTLLGLQSSNRLSRWEAGKAYPSVVNALKLATLYGVRVEEMYSDINYRMKEGTSSIIPSK